MKKQNHKFILFWERTRRVNKWRFLFPVGIFLGIILFVASQFLKIEEQEFLYFLIEFFVALSIGVFLFARLIWFYNEKKFIKTLRKINSPLSI